MTSIVFFADPVSGKCALFDEPDTGGLPDDIHASRNGPLLDPASHLDKVYFHTDLDNLEVESDSTVTISHALVPAGSNGGVSAGGGVSGSGGDNTQSALAWGGTTADNLLVTHGLGYVPDFMVVVGNNTLFPGMPVQTFVDGRGRYVSAYATASAIRLYEWTSVAGVAMPAQNITYRVLVFRQQREPSGNLLFDFDPATGIVQMANGRFQSDRRYLQVVPGGSPFGVSLGRQLDLDNGAPRFSFADGTHFDPVPVGQASRFSAVYNHGSGSTTWTNPTWGASMAYEGTYSVPEILQVQAP